MILRFSAGGAGLLVGLLLSSCQTVFQALLGIHGIKAPTPAELAQQAQRLGIPAERSFVLDTSYTGLLRHAAFPAQAKNHAQPLQLLYFDAHGQLRQFYINCNADLRLLNVEWNPDGRLDVFPPRSQTPPDSLLTFTEQIKHLRTASGTHPDTTARADYRLVVYWNRFMGRQTRGLLRAVQHNLRQVPAGQRVEVYYVNNDAIFYHWLK
jgi:hypothetical protein